MQIEFSKQQFRALLDLIHAGNWVINTEREDGPIPEYNDLESYVFSKCAQFGVPEFAEEIDGAFIPSSDYGDSSIANYIDEYDEKTVNRKLAETLSYRDAPSNLSGEDLNDFLAARYDMYLAEFDENGFQRLHLETDTDEE